MIISVLKKSFFHFFLDIFLQQWRKNTSPLCFQENKVIMLYNFTRKTKASSCKRSRMKSKIVAFLLVNVWLNLTQFYITRSNLACSDANNDSRFFQFWYSTKPFQIDIDIHTKKTLWKVHVTLNLKQPDHEKPYKFYKTPQNLLRLGCFLVT